MQRVLQQGQALSEPFSAYNGLGQGDILSLIPALLLVSWQFKMMDKEFPDIQKGAYYDDRTFCGDLDTLIEVDTAVHQFDEAAGQKSLSETNAFLFH